jgi:hypothetical protein
MKNVFIDSNIWLSLYAFSNDDLNQFMKLSDLVGKDICIILPEQVRDEVRRNRETKIKEVMSKFKDWKLDIPNICKGYPQYFEFAKTVNALKITHQDFIKQIEKDIESKELHADKAIQTIMGQSTFIPRSNEIVDLAVLRYNIGNPPGKEHKYGDAINWLSLLLQIPKGEDLFFIGADGDYQSVVDKNRFNQFLLDEWQDTKESDIFFFKSLTEFFNTHIQNIKIRNELIADQEKDSLISELECSGSFANTHWAVSRLSAFKTWTDEQVNRILDAVESNSQVGYVSGDDDVADFLKSLPNVERVKQADAFDLDF